ncbi:hypothetical protein [Alteribacillus sp. HJP-4]|uniref:hypothetical protein n=1 Tax=Alteribacillus sp. HJP-4 TaxID=2775394 RepID=UPI0035CD32B3
MSHENEQTSATHSFSSEVVPNDRINLEVNGIWEVTGSVEGLNSGMSRKGSWNIPSVVMTHNK